MAKPTKSERKVRAAFREVYADEPAVVAQTRESQGPEAAQQQKVAIALSKARAKGALVRRSARGSPAPAGQNLTRGYARPNHAGRPDGAVQQGYRRLGG